MKHGSGASVVAVLSVALSAGCLDWSSSRRAHDAGVAAEPDAGDDDAGELAAEAGQASTDPGSSDAALADDDAGAPASDAAAADAAHDDAGDDAACPAAACPALFPCLGSARDFVCQGQYAEFPLPARDIRDSLEVQGFVIDVDAGTVLDQVTGLMWERVLIERVGYAAAEQHCADLDLGGHRDWRLPTVHELVTWFPRDEVPGFDPRVLRAPFNLYGMWSSTSDDREDFGRWAVSIAGDGAGLSDGRGEAAAMCVRTAQVLVRGTPDQRFELMPSGQALRDTHTGLVWELAYHDARTKTQAQSTCDTLGLDALQFDLPSLSELISIMDMSQAPGYRFPRPFQRQDGDLWTRTRTTLAETPSVFVVLSHGGDTQGRNAADELERAGVRCVARPR